MLVNCSSKVATNKMLKEECKNRANNFLPFPYPLFIPDSKFMTPWWFLHTWKVNRAICWHEIFVSFWTHVSFQYLQKPLQGWVTSLSSFWDLLNKSCYFMVRSLLRILLQSNSLITLNNLVSSVESHCVQKTQGCYGLVWNSTCNRPFLYLYFVTVF